MYIYESHLGGLYATDEEISFDNLFCETCGDCDNLLGQADTKKEALKLIESEHYNKSYIKDFLKENFEA